MLEIAVGPGRLSAEVGAASVMVGLDGSPNMLAEARRRTRARGQAWNFVRGDGFRLPFASGSIDLIYTIRFLRHFDRAGRDTIYRELTRVLRPGGHLVLDAQNRLVSLPHRLKQGLHTYKVYDELWLRDALRPVSPRSEIVAVDVADAARVREVIDDVVARHGRLDVLINNAAVEERRSILQTTLEDVERAMRVNFGGMVHCTLAALPAMVRQGAGRIVNVASAVGRSPVPGEAAYAASKAAMIAFSESISYELAPKGIRVQVLFPGYVADTRIAVQARAAGQTVPPRWVHRTAAQVSRAVLRALDDDAFEINAARLETLAPIVRAVAPALYRRAIVRTQPPP